MFGSQINFTHKYKDTFKTMEGAILTLLIFLALAIIAGIYLHNMVQRSEQILNITFESSDLFNDEEPFGFFTGVSHDLPKPL